MYNFSRNNGSILLMLKKVSNIVCTCVCISKHYFVCLCETALPILVSVCEQ